MRPELGAISTLVTVLSCPLSWSLSLKVLPTRPYSSTVDSRATARVFLSAENEWSAMGLWKRWWTSGSGIVAMEGFAIGVALYYRWSCGIWDICTEYLDLKLWLKKPCVIQ